MTWTPFSTSFGNDGQPVHSALARDVLRDNFVALKAAPCVGGCCAMDTAPLSTTSASFEVLAWFPMAYVRAPLFASGGMVHSVRIEMWAQMSSNTGTLRVVALPSAAHITVPTPQDTALYTTTSTGAVTTTAAWHSLTLALDSENVHRTVFGGDTSYQVVWGGILGRREAGGTLTVYRYTWEEL